MITSGSKRFQLEVEIEENNKRLLNKCSIAKDIEPVRLGLDNITAILRSFM